MLELHFGIIKDVSPECLRRMTVRETWILFLYRLATVSSIADDAEDTLQT